jgi:dienelactone hydrolase
VRTIRGIALLVVTVGLVSPAVRAQSPPVDLAARATQVADRLAAGQTSAVVADFDARMTAVLPEAGLKTAWASLTTQFGAFQRHAAVKTVPQGALTLAIVSCQFERAWIDEQVTFDAGGKISGLSFRPGSPVITSPLPDYAVPASFTERDVTIGVSPWVLPATLTRPVRNGLVPAVVLVHGSGANSRDEAVGGSAPFRDLAAGLASHGVAVLRYDKRTNIYPGQAASIRGATVKDEVIDDALAAVEFLRHDPSVDSHRIVVLGHSLGGMVVPRIGQSDPQLAGLIVMAGNTRQIDAAVVEQSQYLADADGVVTPQEQAQIDAAKQVAAAVARLTSADVASPSLIYGAPASYWLDMRAYNPPAIARGLSLPMLVLQGERDYQVTMTDFGAWKAGLTGRSNVTFKSYPALNHLMIAGTGKSLPAEYAVPGHVDGAVVKDIAQWVLGVPPAGGPATAR